MSQNQARISQLTALGIPNAANLLEKYSWNVEKAVSAYFDGIEPSNTSNISKTKQSSLKRERDVLVLDGSSDDENHAITAPISLRLNTSSPHTLHKIP